MNCTCSKRLLPCPVHKDKHLAFVPDSLVKVYVINVQETWPVESTLVQDKRYYTSVVEDAVRVFKSRDCITRNGAVLEAVRFLEGYLMP